MDMIKITKEMIPEVETVQVCGRDGAKMIVKKYIPYHEKETIAMEYIALVNTTNTQTEFMYDNYKRMLIRTVLICKHYTNIDVSSLENEDDWAIVFDYLVFNGLIHKMLDIVSIDMRDVDDISRLMKNPMKQKYNKENDLLYLIKKTFGSILTGQDFAEAIAKMPDINNQMIDILDVMKQKKQHNVGNNGKIITKNGNVVNLAKKQK